MPFAESDPTDVVTAAPGGPVTIPGSDAPLGGGEAYGGSGSTAALWHFILADRYGNDLSDISSISYDKQLSRRLNRPATVSFRVPSWHALVSTLASDGNPILEVGVRSLKVYRDGRLMFNGIVWHLEDSGDEDTTFTQVTCYDPMIWWRFRPARDSNGTGDFSTPVFDATTGPELLREIIDNSRVDTNNAYGEGPMGIDIGTITPGDDEFYLDIVDTPYTIADIHQLLADTGQVDAWIEPKDDGATMGSLTATFEAGTDKPWLHFQYGTGDFSCQNIKRERDMDQLCNKLWYYLGPKKVDTPTLSRWRGNITATGVGNGSQVEGTARPLPEPTPQGQSLAELLDRMNDSRSKYGVFMDIKIYDANNDEFSLRHLYARIFESELYLRSEPRELLYVTPTRNGPFDVTQIEMGDTIRVSAFDGIRRGFAAVVQRVYGWTVSIDNDGVEGITELVTSPSND